jgi:hypothetical protein
VPPSVGTNRACIGCTCESGWCGRPVCNQHCNFTDILKLKNCLYTTIIYLEVKGRLLLHVSACGHLQVGSLDF